MFLPKTRGLYAPSDRVQFQPFFTTGMPFADGSNPSFNLFFSLEDGPMFDPCKTPGSRSLHERKLASWALLVGETHSSASHAEMRRRPHRGMLPDVDFSMAVPAPRRPSLVRRFIGLFKPRLVKTDVPASASQEGERGPVGEGLAASRPGRDHARQPAARQAEEKSDATAWARAA
jgi:hypothetical protein